MSGTVSGLRFAAARPHIIPVMAKTPTQTPVQTANVSAPRPRALIVEDDRVVFSQLQVLLMKKGWDVTLAATLEAGRAELAKSPKPDWLILDLMLPDGDGATLLSEIRKSKLPVKVAVLTVVNEFDRLASVQALGPEAMLRKPPPIAELYRVMGIER